MTDQQEPKHGDVRVTVRFGNQGQKEAYASSTFEGVLFIERFVFDAWKPDIVASEDCVKLHYSRMVHYWSEIPEPCTPQVYKISNMGDGLWEVILFQQYAD